MDNYPECTDESITTVDNPSLFGIFYLFRPKGCSSPPFLISMFLLVGCRAYSGPPFSGDVAVGCRHLLKSSFWDYCPSRVGHRAYPGSSADLPCSGNGSLLCFVRLHFDYHPSSSLVGKNRLLLQPIRYSACFYFSCYLGDAFACTSLQMDARVTSASSYLRAIGTNASVSRH